nr:hypothetical protein [Chlamydiota bacterium]
ICNCKAFFILEMWAARGIIQDLLGPKIAERTALEKKKINTCITVSLVIAAIAISTFTQIPYALPAADYSPRNKAFVGIFSLVASIFIPTRSMQLTLSKAYEKSPAVKKNPTLSKFQMGLVQLTRENQAGFISLNMIDKKDWIHDLRSIKSQESNYNKLISYLKWICLESKEIHPQLGTCSQKYSNYTSRALGLFITGVFEYAIAKYSFNKTKELIWENDIFSGCTAFVTTASCLYIYGESILKTSERIFNGMREIVGKKRISTLGEQLWPKLNIGLKLEESVTNLFALGPTFVIWGDLFKTPTWEHWFFVTTIMVAKYFTLSTASFDTINDFTETLTLGAEKKEIVEQNKEFKSLISTFENCSQKDLALFLLDLPEDLKSQLCERIGISQNDLTRDCHDLFKEVDLEMSADPNSEELDETRSLKKASLRTIAV